MKTYTRTGDEGTTALVGGLRVAKFDDRVEAYGTVDELSAFVAVLHDQEGVAEEVKQVLQTIQDKLLIIESHFALESGTEIKKLMPQLAAEDVCRLEQHIDSMNAHLPELKAFVVPGGNLKASYAHVCRTVCRRAERIGWKLASEHEVELEDLKYLNRLSDFFFVLARCFCCAANISEKCWKSVR